VRKQSQKIFFSTEILYSPVCFCIG